MPPVEAVKEGHTEKDGDSEVAPPSRDNPTVAQGKGTVVALVAWVPPSSRCCLVSPWARQMSPASAVLLCASLLLLSVPDVLEQPTLPAAEGLCHCDTCGRRHVWDGAREGRGFCSEHCHQQFKER